LCRSEAQWIAPTPDGIRFWVAVKRAIRRVKSNGAEGIRTPGLVNASHGNPPYTQLQAVMLTNIFKELSHQPDDQYHCVSLSIYKSLSQDCHKRFDVWHSGKMLWKGREE